MEGKCSICGIVYPSESSLAQIDPPVCRLCQRVKEAPEREKQETMSNRRDSRRASILAWIEEARNAHLCRYCGTSEGLVDQHYRARLRVKDWVSVDRGNLIEHREETDVIETGTFSFAACSRCLDFFTKWKNLYESEAAAPLREADNEIHKRARGSRRLVYDIMQFTLPVVAFVVSFCLAALLAGLLGVKEWMPKEYILFLVVISGLAAGWFSYQWLKEDPKKAEEGREFLSHQGEILRARFVKEFETEKKSLGIMYDPTHFGMWFHDLELSVLRNFEKRHPLPSRATARRLVFYEGEPSRDPLAPPNSVPREWGTGRGTG